MSVCSVRFRDEHHDVVVDSDSGYDYETNSRDIEWHFKGLTSDQHNALRLTDKEEDDIYQQLCLREEDDNE